MHTSVLLKETLEYLNPKEGDIFLDCTINGGGHAEAIARKLGKKGVIMGIDEDAEALEEARVRLENLPPKKFFFQGNFKNLDAALASFGVMGIDKILFDLGLSLRQIEISGRGFSFQKDESLVMTFSAEGIASDVKFTAGEIVNGWGEENIAAIIESYGEEKFAKRIARAIVLSREEKEIKTARELAKIIDGAVPAWYRRGKIHPATKSFQALRMAVNDEVRALQEGLSKAWEALLPGGRIAVISFHSIEDRHVKNFFKEKEKLGEGRLVTKKPVVPRREEQKENKRSRSAKLRAIEKL